MKFVKVKEVKTPTTAYDSAGIDCYAVEDDTIFVGETKKIPLGILVQINEDEVAIVSERSSQGMKGITTFGNVIDADYRGEIHCMIFNSGGHKPYNLLNIKKGDKICQLLILKLGNKEIKEVKALTKTTRGQKSFGSTTKKTKKKKKK